MRIFQNIQDSPYKNQVFDSFYLFLFTGINNLLPLIIIPYLLVVLGAEGYGYIGFATALCNYFVLIVNFGFNFSATKSIAIAFEKKDEKELSRVFFSTLYSKLILLILSVFLFYLCLRIPQFKKYSVTTLCMAPLIISNVFTFGWLYQGIGKIKILSIINTIVKILILPFIFLLVKSPEDYNIAAIIQSSVYMIAAVISVIVIRKYVNLFYVKIKWDDIKNSIKDSWPLFLSSVATSVYTQIFTMILAFYSPTSAVGKYSAAERIMRSCCSIIYGPVSQAFYPKVAALGAIDINKAKRLLRKLLRVLFVIMAILGVVFLIFADIISGLLGEGYEGIGNLLRIISIAPIAIALGGVTGQMGLIALGNSTSKKHFTYSYWISGVTSLAIVFVMTRFLGEMGTAISMVLTEYLVFTLMSYYYKKDSLCY